MLTLSCFRCTARDPFPLSASATATLPSASLRTLANLRKAPKQDALRVLRALKTSSDQVSAWIQDEMRKTEGWAWPVQVGFHANESMRHVHLHVISSDLISPKLKNKKHYNSFHPSLGFFLHLNDVIAEVESGRAETKSIKEYDELLKLPLKSHYTDHQFANLPKLKVRTPRSLEFYSKLELTLLGVSLSRTTWRLSLRGGAGLRRRPSPLARPAARASARPTTTPPSTGNVRRRREG